MINVGDIYLDCDGTQRRCVEADGDEVYGVALTDETDFLWCSHTYCQPQLKYAASAGGGDVVPPVTRSRARR